MNDENREMLGNILERMTMKNNAEIRRAVADYMSSEGCSCCQDVDAHCEHKKHLAMLLKVPMYSDKSGYDFSRFRSKKKG